MSLLSHLWHRLADWFAEAVPTGASEPVDREPPRDAAEDAEADETRRTSIRDVTLEQLGLGHSGLAHWSCHTHF